MCNLFLPPATAALTRAQLPYLPRTGDLLRLLRVGANKAMSQNFILDMNVNRRVRPACVYVRTCAQIVRIMPAPVKDAHICEVGPGPGGITRALLENDCLSLTGIEIDRRFFPMLEVCACRCASAQFTSCYVTQPAIGLILCTAMCLNSIGTPYGHRLFVALIGLMKNNYPTRKSSATCHLASPHH
jgi:hypothetical protein